ncbi:MAG: (2Fe-2S)-binding protein [Oleiphilus sp.]
MSCIINNQSLELDIEDQEMPLLWLLRDQLNLTGTKYSCLEGVCGACSVLLDGQAIRSCQLLVRDCVNKKITTIEGLSQRGLNPVQQAWLEADIPQCGFCQPGQVINLSGFLNNHSEPNEQQLLQALSSNYCRCKTYPDMLMAAKKALEYLKIQSTAGSQPDFSSQDLAADVNDEH